MVKTLGKACDAVRIPFIVLFFLVLTFSTILQTNCHNGGGAGGASGSVGDFYSDADEDEQKEIVADHEEVESPQRSYLPTPWRQNRPFLQPIATAEMAANLMLSLYEQQQQTKDIDTYVPKKFQDLYPAAPPLTPPSTSVGYRNNLEQLDFVQPTPELTELLQLRQQFFLFLSLPIEAILECQSAFHLDEINSEPENAEELLSTGFWRSLIKSIFKVNTMLASDNSVYSGQFNFEYNDDDENDDDDEYNVYRENYEKVPKMTEINPELTKKIVNVLQQMYKLFDYEWKIKDMVLRLGKDRFARLIKEDLVRYDCYVAGINWWPIERIYLLGELSTYFELVFSLLYDKFALFERYATIYKTSKNSMDAEDSISEFEDTRRLYDALTDRESSKLKQNLRVAATQRSHDFVRLLSRKETSEKVKAEFIALSDKMKKNMQYTHQALELNLLKALAVASAEITNSALGTMY